MKADENQRMQPAADGTRPYRTPTLTEYGSIARLTQGALSFQGDQGSGGFRATK